MGDALPAKPVKEGKKGKHAGGKWREYRTTDSSQSILTEQDENKTRKDPLLQARKRGDTLLNEIINSLEEVL